MRVELNEKGHVYTVNGDIASISVTELLSKHGLAPNYSKVNKAQIKKSAERGKEVHKDLENVLNVGKYEPTTEQGKQFKRWVDENLDCGVGEQSLALEYAGMIIAGTADVMGIAKNGDLLIADHKNTSKFHREYVSWQVSLLDYFARKLGDEPINGKILKWKGAKKFICFHYNNKTGDMSVQELEKISDKEIEELIKCEYENKKYKRKELVVEPELKSKFLQAEEYLSRMELVYKEAKQNAEKLREEMLKIFEEQGIESWESPNKKVKISYVKEAEVIAVDKDKLKKKFPQVFSECQKLSSKKAYIRVTVRNEEE